MSLTGVLLAAGSGSRFGANKLLYPLPGGELLGVASAKSLISAVSRAVAVVRPEAHELAGLLEALGYRVIENKRSDLGIGESLSLAIRSSLDATGWMIGLADMPWIKRETLTSLVERLELGASMVAPSYNGKRGHPVGFSDKWGNQLSDLSGDKGAKQLLLSYPTELEIVPTDDPGVLQDIDYPAELSVAEQTSASGKVSMY